MMYVFHSAIAVLCPVQMYTFLDVCWTSADGLCKKWFYWRVIFSCGSWHFCN